MRVLVTYDIDKNHNKVKAYMLKLGYKDEILGMKGTTFLPNTTLYYENRTKEAAYIDLLAACKAESATLEKYFIVEFDKSWTGMVNKIK